MTDRHRFPKGHPAAPLPPLNAMASLVSARLSPPRPACLPVDQSLAKRDAAAPPGRNAASGSLRRLLAGLIVPARTQ